jgi:hypothetical protein
MALLVSPGISISETDLTAGTSAVSVSDAAFAGPFQWGPALIPVSIGSEDDLVSTFGTPDTDTVQFWFSAQAFLAYSNLLHVVRAITPAALNATTLAKTLTGSVIANGTNWVASGNTGFLTTGLVVGQEVVVNTVIYTIQTVVNTTAITVSPTPNASVVNATAISAYGLLVKNADDYNNNFSDGLSGYGSWVAKYPGSLGNGLTVSICSGATAFTSNPTGNVTVTSGSNSVSGSGTTFQVDLQVHDFITVGSQKLQVSAITSNTVLAVFTAPSKNVTATYSRTWQYATLFDAAPGTGHYTSQRGGANDEMHMVVSDADGSFTGTPGTVLERFPFMSKAADSKNDNGDQNYYVNVINTQSAYVWWLLEPGTSTANWGTNAKNTSFNFDALPNNQTLVGGQTDNANIGDSDLETAYDYFTDADAIDISLVITGPASAGLQSYIIQNICEVRAGVGAGCVAFCSPGEADVVNNRGGEVTAILAHRNQLPSSSYGLMDSGWKYMLDKYNNTFAWVPLNGDMAGIAAQTDTTNAPWFSPAGLTRGNVKNVTKLAWNPKQVDRDTLYKASVNPVIQIAGGGTVLYGDKTLLNRPSAFDRINVRRLFIVLEKTIKRTAQTQLFEFNDDFTRAQFRNIVEPYLRDVKAQRGVVDYLVVCDSTNNTDNVIQQNQFVGDIYIKPNRSINTIQLNFVAVSDSVSFQEITGSTAK